MRSSIGYDVAQRESDGRSLFGRASESGPNSILGWGTMEVHLAERPVDAIRIQEGKLFGINEFMIVLK